MNPGVGREVAAAVDAEIQRIQAVASVEDRVYEATQIIDLLQKRVSELAKIRSESMRGLRSDGWTLSRISTVFGISRARAAQLTASTDGGGPDGGGHDGGGSDGEGAADAPAPRQRRRPPVN